MEIHEKGDEMIVDITGPSKSASDLLSLEALLRGLGSWAQDINFKEGKAPKRIKKTWYLPTKKVRPKLNPKSKKAKAKAKAAVVPEDALVLYRQFNGTDPKEIKVIEAWLPDLNSPLVALGEGECPFVGYCSAKSTKGKVETFIHHFGETGKKKPRIYVTMPPSGYDPMLIITGGKWAIEERSDGNLWLVD
jgi:hypothetical protein